MENTENNTESNLEVKLDSKQRAYATGKRKNSIARVWLKRGSGNISINGKEIDKYFARPVLQMIVNQPLDVVDGEGAYEIMATVKGGGLSGHALFERTCEMIFLFSKFKMPIMATGGISSIHHLREARKLGASLFGMATSLVLDPYCIPRINYKL